jgi:hypothetical protein
MNKIERAIYDCNLHIKSLEQDRIILTAELSAFKKQLSALEAIRDNKSIPHQEMDKPVKQTNNETH